MDDNYDDDDDNNDGRVVYGRTNERTNEQRTKEAQTAGPPLPFDRSSMLEATCKGRRNLMVEGSLFAITTPLLKMMSESKFGWRQIF